MFFSVLDQVPPNGVEVNIAAMNDEIAFVTNPVVGKPACPNLRRQPELSRDSKRKSAFDKLHRALQRFGRGDDHVDMVWHDHERVESKAALGPVFVNRVEEQFGDGIALKNGSTGFRACGDEVCARR